nr:MAG TPA: hypothetical protein [Caudoviricetes sp.]
MEVAQVRLRHTLTRHIKLRVFLLTSTWRL